ncbi:tail protein X [Ancylobacter polymorphus]|uniref:Phage tail protein X n=1 Tax=Ancylobacter polymorphus TaxID=223390 RepID=A0ABU0B7I5_9HYPH|nr:tail protein X [Ancylobacter polymorphus]MDQ0301345.1 phage tail protein X [Ancylobacter polymorphus]
MTITYEEHEVKNEGFTLSRIIWRRFKRPMIGMHERILNLNQGLAAKGPELPIGTKIVIPIDPPSAAPASDIVQLWD